MAYQKFCRPQGVRSSAVPIEEMDAYDNTDDLISTDYGGALTPEDTGWPLNAQTIQTIKSTPRGKASRKPKYDWDAARAHIEDLFRYHGLPSPDDPNWSCQADVERAIQSFFLSEIGEDPAPSTARQKASDFIADYIAEFEAGSGR